MDSSLGWSIYSLSSAPTDDLWKMLPYSLETVTSWPVCYFRCFEAKVASGTHRFDVSEEGRKVSVARQLGDFLDVLVERFQIHGCLGAVCMEQQFRSDMGSLITGVLVEYARKNCATVIEASPSTIKCAFGTYRQDGRLMNKDRARRTVDEMMNTYGGVMERAFPGIFQVSDLRNHNECDAILIGLYGVLVMRNMVYRGKRGGSATPFQNSKRQRTPSPPLSPPEVIEQPLTYKAVLLRRNQPPVPVVIPVPDPRGR